MNADHPEVKFGKTGVLIINLGTPDSTSWWDIRKYLKEFLSDRRVIEVNPIIWKVILNLFILTFRPSKTAHAYKKIVEFCKKEKIPSICFPKGLGKKYLEFNNIVQPDGINIDYEIEPLWAKENLKNVVIQGGLHPKALLKTEEEMFKEATKYIQTFKDTPYVFNLGHGLLPETDPDRVKKLIKFYRDF